MTHSVIRLTELNVDPTSALGYTPTTNQILLTGTDEKRLNGRIFTTPIVRDDTQPEGSGQAATTEQLALLHAIAEDGADDPGLVVERVHGEVTLPADRRLLAWLLDVKGGVISVEFWRTAPAVDDVPAWTEADIKLLHLRDLFTTLTGDVLWFEAPAEDSTATVGPVVSDWGCHQGTTTTPPPGMPPADVHTLNAAGEASATQ